MPVTSVRATAKTVKDTNQAGRKVFILDTNVLLVDPDAIDNFEDNLVVLSMTVLEELDGLKKRASTGHEARLAIQKILALTTRNKAGEPVELRSSGQFIIDVSPHGDKCMEGVDLTLDKPDNRLLALAIRYKNDPVHPNRVVVVTNDAAVRVKAHALGLASEEYVAVNYQNQVDELYQPPPVLKLDNPSLETWLTGKSVQVNHPVAQSVLVDQGDQQTDTGYVEDGNLHHYGALLSTLVKPLNAQQELALQVLYDQRKRIVALVGHAGTGKTILALAAAIEQKLLSTSPGKVYIFRPNDQVADDIGFLPGRIDEKFMPYKRAIRDAYEVIQGAIDKVKKGKRLPDFDTLTNDEGGGRMPILPINFMRGSTLHNAIMIIDEAQNFSTHQMKTLLTRAGRNTRVIITGDPNQIDNRFLTKRSCGLTHVIGKMRGHGVFEYIYLNQGERSEIASLAAEVL
ncbi:MAG: PhoH family protein [Gammaproteobacteria bacterium]|nr:PhoH family protein [Gammaproteobacteria bacterium]